MLSYQDRSAWVSVGGLISGFTVELKGVEKFTLIPLVKVVIFNVLVELNGPFNSFDEQQFSPFRVNFNPFSVNF